MLIDRFSFCERGYSSSVAVEKAIVCCFVDVSNNCGRREVVLSAGEVAVRDVMMGTRVVDVDMTDTEKKAAVSAYSHVAVDGSWTGSPTSKVFGPDAQERLRAGCVAQ